MLPGFPKTVIRRKVKTGHYLLIRDDDHRVEVMRGAHGWFIRGSGQGVPSLRSAIVDLKHGYTAHDQLARRK